jgi:hypothetical protein
MRYARIHPFAVPFVVALVALIAGTARAATGGFAAIRSELGSQVGTIVGPSGAAKVRPFVDDATARIERAVRTVASTDEPPRRILTMSQKIAFFRSRASGSEPDIQLSSDQREKLQTYARDVARSVLPIVRDDGDKIQQTLSPQQIAALADLRSKTLERLKANAPETSILPDTMSLLVGDGEVLSPGAFVLIVNLDPQRIVQGSR